MLRNLIHWGVCLGFIMCCMKSNLSASGWTCVGSDMCMVDSPPEELFFTQGNSSIKLELANPLRPLTSEEISIIGYFKAIMNDAANAVYDIAMQLLIKHESMDVCEKKTQLGKFLNSCAKDFVAYTFKMFQRDYVLLCQAYIFYMKTKSPNDSLFISYTQKAFNLAEAHEDEPLRMCVIDFFLDRLTTGVGHFIARKIIDSELALAKDQRFLHAVILRYSPTSPPPVYQEAVQSLSKSSIHESSPPPYTTSE